jgi:short-subunit dehydrogenase
MKKIVIIGATSAIATHCAQIWLEKFAPLDLTLLGRDAQRLERLAADLRVRSPQSNIHVSVVDFGNADAIQNVANAIATQSAIDIALIAHGNLPDQIACQNDLKSCHAALDTNGVSPVLFAEAFAQHMTRCNHGTLALIGSVAGDRGRKSNYVYGAAKGLVTRYAQGLQHRLAGTGVKVILIKPGPTATPMTAHLQGQGVKLAPVEEVAQDIVDAIDAGKTTLYTPGKWRIIMLIIRLLPFFIFKKMNI